MSRSEWGCWRSSRVAGIGDRGGRDALIRWCERLINQRKPEYVMWCRRRDLNPHGLRHTPLKRACLPFHHFGDPCSEVSLVIRLGLAGHTRQARRFGRLIFASRACRTRLLWSRSQSPITSDSPREMHYRSGPKSLSINGRSGRIWPHILGSPTLCRVTTALHPRSKMSLNNGHRGPSPRCLTSTTHFCLEKPARYDFSGFYGGAAWWDGAS